MCDRRHQSRSPWAYTINPAKERAQHKYDVDKNMTLLRIDDASGNPIGMIDWFAVHGTSMNNTNTLVSGDNKGHAMYLFERMINGNDSLAGRGPFVAAFSQANEVRFTFNRVIIHFKPMATNERTNRATCRRTRWAHSVPTARRAPTNRASATASPKAVAALAQVQLECYTSG
jgi:hypothetical protein